MQARLIQYDADGEPLSQQVLLLLASFSSSKAVQQAAHTIPLALNLT